MPTSVNNAPPSATKNRGWFSKLIDPAARLLFSTVTHLFTSSISGATNTNSIQEIPQLANISAPQIREQREDFVDIKLSFHYNGITMTEQELSSRFDDLFELGSLISQKSFTKEEIDFLNPLIHSRVVEPGNCLILEGNDVQSKEKENDDSNTNSRDNLDCSKPPEEPPSTLGFNPAVSPPINPKDFVSTDVILRPCCRSAFRTRFSRSSRKNKNIDLIRPLKWRRPSQFYNQFCHRQALKKRSRSNWNEECSDGDGERRVRQKTCLLRPSQFNTGDQLCHQQALKKRSRSDWNEECSDDDGQRRVRQKTCLVSPSQFNTSDKFCHQQALKKRSRSDWNEECSDDEGQRRVRQKTDLF